MSFAIVLAILLGLILVLIRARQPNSAPVAPSGDSSIGTIQRYFDKISEMEGAGFEDFFVSAKAVGGDHIVQVAVSRDPFGSPVYELDMPIADWSLDFVERIENEAEARGHEPARTDGGPMEFLDVSIRQRQAHDVFTAWVVEEVYGLDAATLYEITSG